MGCYADWMSLLGDEHNISRMALPGSHVSAAYFKLAPPSSRCQKEGICAQLENGVRFLDLRVSKDYMNRGSQVDNLIMVNGKFPVKLYGSYRLNECLGEIYAFLDAHPLETVVVSITQEGAMLNWDHGNDEFANVLFQRYVAKKRSKWYLSSRIPALKSCRGKIVLVRRFPVKEGGQYTNFGIPSIFNLHNGLYENRLCCVQEVKNIKTPQELKSKVELIQIMMQKSAEHHSGPESEPKLFINFCSCSNAMSKQWWPSSADRKFREFNIHSAFHSLCGVLVFDFVERDNWQLIHALVDANF